MSPEADHKTTMNKKVVAFAVALLAIAAIGGTSAFTSVTADRTAQVNTAGDANAYLALAPHNGANGAQYASTNSADELELQFAGTDTASVNGLNDNATTVVERVFNVTNNGNQQITVWITDSGASQVDWKTAGASMDNELGTQGNVTVDPGGTIEVSTTFDFNGQSEGTFMSSMTIHAESTA